MIVGIRRITLDTVMYDFVARLERAREFVQFKLSRKLVYTTPQFNIDNEYERKKKLLNANFL